MAALIHVNALLTAAGTNAGHGHYPTNDGAAGARPDPGCRSETAPWRGAIPHALPQLRSTAAALQSRLPRRREHPGLAGAGAGRRLPPGVGDADGGQSAAGDARPGLLPPVRNGLQPRRDGRPRCRSTRSSAFLATWRRRNAGRFRRRPRPAGEILVVGAGPSGLSAAYHLARLGHQVEIREAGPLPGGMLHFGIPAYRLPRADLLAEIARIEQMGVRIVLNHKVTDLQAEREFGPLRRGVRRDRRARRQARRHPRARRGAGAGCRGAAARHRHRQHAAARSPGGGVRRRQHGDGCRAEPRAGWAPTRR